MKPFKIYIKTYWSIKIDSSSLKSFDKIIIINV